MSHIGQGEMIHMQRDGRGSLPPLETYGSRVVAGRSSSGHFDSYIHRRYTVGFYSQVSRGHQRVGIVSAVNATVINGWYVPHLLKLDVGSGYCRSAGAAQVCGCQCIGERVRSCVQRDDNKLGAFLLVA